jgi:hypothetical protein
MTMPHVAVIESPPRAISYTMVRAAFDRALAQTNCWPVYAQAHLDRGDSTWLPDSTTRRYIAHGGTRVVYTQYQDGAVDFETFRVTT